MKMIMNLKRPALIGFCNRVVSMSLLVIALAMSACHDKSPVQPENHSSAPPAPSISAEQVVERNRATEKATSSLVKSRAHIQESDGSKKEIRMTVYRRWEADGSQKMLVEFNTPEEKDRAGLIMISPQGDVEGTRYAQSTNNFVTSADVAGEDGLFGMSLQELADGQPEKYDFKVVKEEMVGSRPAYRLEGKLKPGEESKFPRMVVLVSKENFTTLAIEFYDNQDELARKITMDKIEQVDGHWTRMKWTVDNIARKKTVVFETESAKYDQNLNDSIFTRENLKRIASR